jgi:hypothetical protein
MHTLVLNSTLSEISSPKIKNLKGCWQEVLNCPVKALKSSDDIWVDTSYTKYHI